MNDIRIVLADDEKLLRTALATLLEMEGGIRVEEVAADGNEAVEAVRRIAGNRDAALLADLALAYAGSSADGDAAVASRYGSAAYRLAPMNAAVCDAYAVALAAAGNLDGARQLAAKAVSLAPGDPLIAAHARRIAA